MRLADSTLLLDVDGTLLNFADSPEHVVADSELIATLNSLSLRTGGALALVSGRTIASLDRIFHPLRCVASGMHGAEYRLHDGKRVVAAKHTLPLSALARVKAFVENNPGLLAEEKTFGVALHYRMAPHLETRCREFIEDLACELGDEYRSFSGKMVLELAAAGSDKGTGLRTLIASRVFAGRRPVFVGDDEPDEDAFRAVNGLGGVSVRVGWSSATAAQYFLEDVADVRAWLGRALGERNQ